MMARLPDPAPVEPNETVHAKKRASHQQETKRIPIRQKRIFLKRKMKRIMMKVEKLRQRKENVAQIDETNDEDEDKASRPKEDAAPQEAGKE
jgi:hypothetical protein